MTLETFFVLEEIERKFGLPSQAIETISGERQYIWDNMQGLKYSKIHLYLRQKDLFDLYVHVPIPSSHTKYPRFMGGGWERRKIEEL